MRRARNEQRCLASARVGCRPWSDGALPHSTSAVPSVWTRAGVGCSPLPSSLSAGAAATRALGRTIYDRDLRSEGTRHQVRFLHVREDLTRGFWGS